METIGGAGGGASSPTMTTMMPTNSVALVRSTRQVASVSPTCAPLALPASTTEEAIALRKMSPTSCTCPTAPGTQLRRVKTN